MTYDRAFATTWQLLLDAICTLMGLGAGREPPILLSSLPDLPYTPSTSVKGRAPLSFIQGPPGRNIALAIGLRAALPQAPLILMMNADSVSLGTNHLIHAARRNVGMTLLLLRAEVTASADHASLDRVEWRLPDYQRAIEHAPTPLEWVSALEASFVARGSLRDPDHLAGLLHAAVEAGGFSVIGVTDGANLPLGVLSRSEAPEYFAAYHEWAKSFVPVAADATHSALAPRRPTHAAPRCEVRIAGFGGQGVKLAGTVLSEAAGLHEGLWATQRGDYGSATRGGPSMVDIVVGSEPITYAGADHPDVLVVLSQGAAQRYARGLKPSARLVADPGEINPLPEGALPVPITALAREHTGKPIAAGMVALGCVAALSEAVSLEALRQSLAGHVPRGAVQKNIAAMEAGYAAARAAAEGGRNE
jgi:2-oxoglutarate ferredoxin oxidoreductase subunit gamma